MLISLVYAGYLAPGAVCGAYNAPPHHLAALCQVPGYTEKDGPGAEFDDTVFLIPGCCECFSPSVLQALRY